MAREISNAAVERAAAQRALKNGDLKERETYTAKQVAMRCGTDAKTMRKFFRSSHSSIEPVGQGGRYEFDAKDMPQIKKEFTAWLARGSVKRPKAMPEIAPQVPGVKPAPAAEAIIDEGDEELTELDGEPTDEELMEIADLELELDMDLEEV